MKENIRSVFVNYLQINARDYKKYENTDRVLERILGACYGIKLTYSDISTIYKAVCNNNEEFEFILPRIETVTRHWYKDVVFEKGSFKVYENTNKDMKFPLEVNTDAPLKVTAGLSGGKNYIQSDQPWVVKGDIVTVDGEQVDDSTAEDIKNITVDGYKLGDGYRTTKKLFTQGQYYNFDGSKETSQSIWYAKRLEEMKAGDYAKVSVIGGRISLSWLNSTSDDANAVYLGNNKWDISGQVIHEDRKGEEICDPKNAVKVADDGSWSVYLRQATVSARTGEPINCYFVRANTDLKYVSAAEDVDKSKESVERINSLLEAMGVVTIRKPVTFDNVTVNGDVTALTAFGLLEGMHSEAAEYIYRDLKEFLIELGYYTKAEFEYIETNVLEWFIPDYIPETEAEIVNWKQNREEDALKYGAIIYPTETGEDGKVTHYGIDAGCDVIAPGNCRVVEKSDTSITIEFDGISQPEIGALDRYTMIIEGIEISGVPVEVQKQDGSSGGSKTIDELVGTTDVILAKQVIGKTGTNAVQVILKNSRGGYIDNIEDYMAPGLDAYNAHVADIARFYFIPYEGGTPGCVSNPSSKREVAVGIGQWTSSGATNNVPYACKMLYEKDPVFCKELKTFIGWTTEQVCADYFDGGGQLVAAFQTIEDRDKEKFMQLQMELLIEEKTQMLNNRGFAWLEERNPVTIGTVWSLYNWGPNMGWENHFDESMTDEQIIISLFKYASTQNSSDGSLNDRWNSQARLALEILDGTFTDIEGWINNKDAYPEYNEGSNPGYLSTK